MRPFSARPSLHRADTHTGGSSARVDLATEVHVDVDWPTQELFFRRELAEVIGRYSDSTKTFREIFHLLSELLGLNRGRLFLFDAATDRLILKHAYGLTREEMVRGVLARGEGVTGQIYESGQLVIVQDIDSEPRYLWRTVPRSALPNGTISMFFFPIQVNGRTCGVFAVNRFRGISRSLASDLEILREVAVQISQLLPLDDLIAERIKARTAALKHENENLKEALHHHAGSYGIIGTSDKIRAVVKQIEQVASSDATVLLLGESGAGKELLAQAVHTASPRNHAPFVRVNCGAVPEALFESELFGHEKGAFTGAATSRTGRFEEAEGGTLFLDEIGDLPLSMQVKLLRALQERTVSRIGSSKERKLDVRIVAATNRDLKQQVLDGTFRLDLFYRLYVVPIHIAPLRERPEDVALLVGHFLLEANKRFKRNVRLSGDALAALIPYAWPGNVRQLQNVVDRLALLSDSAVIDAPAVMTVLSSEDSPRMTEKDALPKSADGVLWPAGRINEADRDQINMALERTGGVKSRAAQKLGMTLSQLNYRIRILGIVTVR
ncbi:sigma-54-dependent Fis family transcriptional regulator [Burkholderia sp. L27(2015)]|uniref:sigma-54 interaction domain-containing protein n=1 Tax=Burkholderia sp. L27(2015) TaxID=1641858 RepID=UPI0020B14FBA|nr:sigma 54-interacting transcriptional regulator [Burkholderia sp. L27(2015)]